MCSNLNTSESMGETFDKEIMKCRLVLLKQTNARPFKCDVLATSVVAFTCHDTCDSGANTTETPPNSSLSRDCRTIKLADALWGG